MLYHHQQQGTVSDRGPRKLWGIECVFACVQQWLCTATGLCECTHAWQILHYHPVCFTCMLTLCGAARHPWKTSGKLLRYCFLKPSSGNGAKLPGGNTGEELEAGWRVGKQQEARKSWQLKENTWVLCVCDSHLVKETGLLLFFSTFSWNHTCWMSQMVF